MSLERWLWDNFRVVENGQVEKLVEMVVLALCAHTITASQSTGGFQTLKDAETPKIKDE